MTAQLSVAGEPITDHIFQLGEWGHDDNLRYLGVRGGGTAANIAAGVAASGLPVSFIGRTGDDDAGHLASADLSAYGVDVAELAHARNRRTRLIFERLNNAGAGRVSGAMYSFSGACPVCSQRDQTTDRTGTNFAKHPAPGTGWVLVDRITADRMRWIRDAISHGANTALDLGAVDYLRFTPIAQALAWLSSFDLINLSSAVARSLQSRANVSSLIELAELIRAPVLICGRGGDGTELVDSRTNKRQVTRVPAPAAIVVDDAGCGDAFLAAVLQRLATQGLHKADITEAAEQATHDVIPVLGTVGARGHLGLTPGLVHAARSWTPYIDKASDELLELGHNNGQCVICRLPLPTSQHRPPPSLPTPPTPSTMLSEEASRRTAPKHGARLAVARLVDRALRVAENEEAVGNARNILTGTGTAYVAGSGGSFSAATYISLLLNTHGGLFTQAIKPADYLTLGIRTNVVIATSYGGRSPDLLAVLEHAASLEVDRLVALTWTRNSPLEHQLRPLREDLPIVYGPDRKGATRQAARERGFVSIAGTVMPCVPWAAALGGRRALLELAHALDTVNDTAELGAKIGTLLLERNGLHVVGGGWAWPAMVDLESKFTEADLGDVTLHEWKDFSHGRFISLIGAGRRARQRRPVLFLGSDDTPYQRQLQRLLTNEGHPTFHIAATTAGYLGGLELLIRVQRLAQAIGESLGIDISRPEHIPQSALRLYSYKGPLP